ncbi:MAG: radical SAM family heme chaperone HemW [Lachnospiraceae bacterium]
MEKEELELYIHIPFCVKKCAYCDFLSAPADKNQQVEYVKALQEEMKSYQKTAEAYIVTSVFFGGGTPSILDPSLMKDMMRTLYSIFEMKEEAEITIEINPGTVTKEKLEVYKEIGVNRISIGLQSTQDAELKLLGRIHSYETFLQTYKLVRHLGFENINIDLISAIPGQSCASWVQTITTVAQLNPEHISAYSLIIEEGTPFYDQYGGDTLENKGLEQDVPPLPNEEDERQMYEDTRRILHTYGYHRYEVSNYAKAGYECRHNLGYWRRTPYLGFGIGAASLLGHVRFANGSDIQKYIQTYLHQETTEELVLLERADHEVLTAKEEREETIFLGLRTMEGIELTDEIREHYLPIIHKFMESECMEIKENRLMLTEKGISVSNYILSEFL